MRARLILLAVFAFVLAGCSSGASPVIPEADISNFPNSTFNAIGILGAYELTIDSDTLSAELIPMRTSAIGEDYIVSGINFFIMAPCSNCLSIAEISLYSFYNAKLIFAITHPFPAGNTSLPPTASNRLDLNVFDVAMLLKPSDTASTTYSLTGTSIYPDLCIEPDGYTTELAEVIGDSSALPYFLVVDDSADEDPPVSTWNKFAMGDSKEFDVIFNLSSGNLKFEIYLTMGYGFSARKPDRLKPKYYNPEFNRKAAWKVIVTPPAGDDPPQVDNTWTDDDPVTTQNVKVEIYDWQIGATVSTEPDFSDADPSHVYAASEVASVSAEIPGMNSTLPVAYSDDGTGSGAPDSPLVYNVPVANENLIAAGDYIGLVRVTDQRAVLSPAQGRDFIIDTPDGFTLENHEMPGYATYQIFPAAVVVGGCGPISGQIDSPPCPITDVTKNQVIDFTVSATSGGGGDPIALYEVDFDYDGMAFNADDSNTDGIFNNVGPFAVPGICEDEVPIDYLVAFRATDSCVPPNVIIFATCLVTVEWCTQPVGNVTISVNRSPGGIFGDPFDPTGPWTLNWDSTGAAQYAIYYDNNPEDGLMNNPQLVAATQWITYTVPPGHLPTNHYVPGTTYVVRARGTIADPNSEVADSEPAFIMANGWETTGSMHIIGNSQGESEGWESGWERNVIYPTTPSFYPCFHEQASRTAHGSFTARVSSDYLGQITVYYPGRWDCVVVETPSVPDSTVRFIDFALGYQYPRANTWGGLIVGTCSNGFPGYPWSNPSQFEWAQVESASPYTGYNNDVEDFLRNTFDDVDTGSAWCWSWNVAPGKIRGGADLNATANPDDNYVGFACAMEYIDGQRPYVDDVAIMIY